MTAERALPLVGDLCRDYRHAWQPHEGGKNSRGWWRTLRCDRCETLRTEHLDSRGDVLTRRYRYPQDYLVRGGPLTAGERGLLRLRHIDPQARRPRARRTKGKR